MCSKTIWTQVTNLNQIWNKNPNFAFSTEVVGQSHTLPNILQTIQMNFTKNDKVTAPCNHFKDKYP